MYFAILVKKHSESELGIEELVGAEDFDAADTLADKLIGDNYDSVVWITSEESLIDLAEEINVKVLSKNGPKTK